MKKITTVNREIGYGHKISCAEFVTQYKKIIYIEVTRRVGKNGVILSS